MSRKTVWTCLLSAAFFSCLLLSQQPDNPAGPPAGGRGGGRGGSGGGRGGGRGASGGAAATNEGPDPWLHMKRVLAIGDVSTGYQLDSVSHALAVIEQIGRDSGAYATMIKTDTQLITKGGVWGTDRWSPKGGRGVGANTKNLNYFDAVFYFGHGDAGLSDQQKADLASFVYDDGKGLIAVNNSLGAMSTWPDWSVMLGGSQAGGFPLAERHIVVEDPAFPGVSTFPADFTFTDAFPILKATRDTSVGALPPFSRDKVHVIMHLDPAKDAAGKFARPDGDYPVVWANTYGKGRVFYSGLGGTDKAWDDPRVQQMYMGAIKWAMGLTDADLKPHPMPVAASGK